jgi:hypothetical protein
MSHRSKKVGTEIIQRGIGSRNTLAKQRKFAKAKQTRRVEEAKAEAFRTRHHKEIIREDRMTRYQWRQQKRRDKIQQKIQEKEAKAKKGLEAQNKPEEKPAL